MTVIDAPPTSETIDVLNPATGEVLAAIPAGSEAAADDAVRAARAAQRAWARRDAAERGRILKDGARRLRAHQRELAELEVAESGKPLAAAMDAVGAGIGDIEQMAELGPLHRGRSLQGGWGAADMMVHEPRGVVALLVPWNFPLAIGLGQVAAALVTGNAVVFKPSEKTPLASRRAVELLEIPDGALQLLLGDARAGAPLAAHPDVDLVMHTGSVTTGRSIAQAAAGKLGKALLELGGKDPFIVDAGVNPEWAADQAAIGAFANAGQVCTSVERIYVHESLAAPFLAALERRARALRVGPGDREDVDMGPLIDAAQRDRVHAHVTQAIEDGARLVCGGEPLDGPGFFYRPTVLADVPADTPLMTEETFGPVAPVRVVRSFDEALEEANGTQYALGATVLTADQTHAQRAWRELSAAAVAVNRMWGGAPGGSAEPGRGSGVGIGYGPELLDELTHTKVVHLSAPQTAS